MPASIDDRNARDALRWLRVAARGDFEAAWKMSDRTLARQDGRRCWHLPRHLQHVWNGAPLDARRVLIRCYHGLGDTIQFIRYAPLVNAVARELLVWAQPQLFPLVTTAPGVTRWLPLHDGDPGVDYDVDVEVMELPYVFRTTLETIPADVPYLHAPAASLAERGRMRIGIVWRAGDWDSRRSIPFDLIARLLDTTEMEWYQLQRGAAPAERHPHLHIVDNVTISQTAGYMCALDLVISIDSMPAHLAGALGIPVWTLLPNSADWRWLEGRSDSPWYPTMRLFRQPAPGDWEAVIRDVREALDVRTPGRRTEMVHA